MAYLPASLDDLVDAADPLDKLTRRHRRTWVKPLISDEGKWAPYHGPRTCVDRTRHVRPSHCYTVETRRGLECMYCGRLWSGRERARERK